MEEKIIQQIKDKYHQLGENPKTYFKGLLHAKPINYWDYVKVDTLLSLQNPRTDFKDEEIFIMYHQVTELMLQMNNLSAALKEKLKEFDYLYNVEWPLVHLNTAEYYLDSNRENQDATGGSEWKKYLHPKFQQRKFFSSLWTETEKQNWGEKIKSNHDKNI